MSVNRFFFSPQPTPLTINKYINNFYDYLCKNVSVVNRRKPLGKSVDFARYGFNCDVMILNWPEDFIHLRFGVGQMLLSAASLLAFKMRGGTIVWVCHNKYSHYQKRRSLSKMVRAFYTRIADHIIVHSKDAIKDFGDAAHKVHFLNHPVYAESMDKGAAQTGQAGIDVLIWGTINPYKGLSEFIDAYRKSDSSFGVTIAGSAQGNYLREIKAQARGLNISIEDRFLTDEELAGYFRRSKIILLPYIGNDTYSSGSLIHSLNAGRIVLGPATGNFVDLENSGACMTYSGYADMTAVIEKLLGDEQYYNRKLAGLKQGIAEYYEANSWQAFIENLLAVIEKKQGCQTSRDAHGFSAKKFINVP